jgi:predicted MPP superfamily phosphohydrolase
VDYWVALANSLKPDLVVLTGDMIDRSMDSLPDLLAGLEKLRPSLSSRLSGAARLGVVAVLGNHDLSSDASGSRGDLLGGENIAQAMRDMGIRMLRNEVIHIGANGFLDTAARSPEALAVMGMDWVRRRDGGNFFAYHAQETRERLTELCGMVEQGTPSILLAHHPDTFSEVREMQTRSPIALTLSGHTHGGGQVVFFEWKGRSYGLTSMQFQYVSGLFQQNGCSLYVNRGLGYFGVPIRINCPPEISRFKLLRAERLGNRVHIDNVAGLS